MAGFRLDEMDQVVQESEGKINFLKLQDDGWYAKVRFMYGPNEAIEGMTVHNVAEYVGSKLPKYVPCLRGVGQPLDTCPLCKAGNKTVAQFFIPVYVISIVSNLRGVQQEEPVGQVMLFQKGTTFGGALKSVVRQAQNNNKPIVSCVFNLVRNGKNGDQKTTYSVELVGTDDTTIEQLPPKPQVLGSYILPNKTAEQMINDYINAADGVATTQNTQVQQQTTPVQQAVVQSATTPRTLNMNTFAGNTVVGGNNFNQAPVQQPQIGGNMSGNVPF